MSPGDGERWVCDRPMVIASCLANGFNNSATEAAQSSRRRVGGRRVPRIRFRRGPRRSKLSLANGSACSAHRREPTIRPGSSRPRGWHVILVLGHDRDPVGKLRCHPGTPRIRIWCRSARRAAVMRASCSDPRLSGSNRVWSCLPSGHGTVLAVLQIRVPARWTSASFGGNIKRAGDAVVGAEDRREAVLCTTRLSISKRPGC